MQRPEKLPHRHVEAKRRLLQHHILRAEPVSLLHPEQPIADPPVRVHHALRATRGTGGKDHVRQVLGPCPTHRLCRALARNVLPLRVELYHLARKRRQLLRQPALGQHNRWPRVLQHQRHALRRVLRIQRHVRAPGLQYPVERDHHLDRALHVDADRHFRPHAQPLQTMRELIRPACSAPRTSAAAPQIRAPPPRGVRSTWLANNPINVTSCGYATRVAFQSSST